MSKLLSYIRALFKTMLPLNNPGTNQVSMEVTSTTQSIIAPIDGYAVAVAGALSTIQAINLNCSGVQSFIPCYLDSWGIVWVPCRKGQTIELVINGTAYPSIRFVESQASSL